MRKLTIVEAVERDGALHVVAEVNDDERGRAHMLTRTPFEFPLNTSVEAVKEQVRATLASYLGELSVESERYEQRDEFLGEVE